MARRRSRATVHGVLVVDKPKGPTSHDVVARVRRALGTRIVGHAGTLDPMATGVLVVAVGEGTKLVRWLTADDKAYEATITLGSATDTLDAEGQVIETADRPEGLDRARAREVAAAFVGPQRQTPPAYSAIKVDGEALHERARRGEAVEVPERDVTVHRLEVLSADADHVELEVESSKGFYVRSLARDLALALGTVGHLSRLRRTRSGRFVLEGAVTAERLERAAAGDEEARAELLDALVPLVDACAAMPRVELDAKGSEDAHHGRPIAAENAAGCGALEVDTEPVALVTDGRLVGIGRRTALGLQVVRGIRPG